MKAGLKGTGKMKVGYFWPVYGERDEVCFPFFPSLAGDCIVSFLGTTHPADAVLLTDGYGPYASYAKEVGITNAQCWSHSRREFVEAQSGETEGVLEALQRIGGIYEIETAIRKLGLQRDEKRQYRQLVDVLQRVGAHPASRGAELTPRLWKTHFASRPWGRSPPILQFAVGIAAAGIT